MMRRMVLEHPQWMVVAAAALVTWGALAML
jgi:hypothetical protein